MIRGKRNDAYGRQTLRVDCCGWESYREAVSYTIRLHNLFTGSRFPVISDVSPNRYLCDILHVILVPVVPRSRQLEQVFHQCKEGNKMTHIDRENGTVLT